MAYACDICGKTAVIGRQGRHHKGVAGGKWKRRAPKTVKVFRPNLHNATINGHRMQLCSKCLRAAKGKQSKVARRLKASASVASA